jgi:hypothetical protein
MYKIASIGLLGLIAILVIPVGTQSMTNDGINLYGQATMVYHDAFGNEMLAQTVHNQLFDEGEDFILEQTFKNATTAITADNVSIGAICLNAAVPVTTETTSNTDFNTAHDAADGGTTETTCKTDGEVGFGSQIATIGPLTFTATAGSGNWFPTDTITSIGVCDATSGNADIRGCTTTLFALVDTSDVTLANGETVDITYTFNIASAGT